MDLGTGKMRENRLGVYLHWIMPRPYRSGVTATPESSSKKTLTAEAIDPSAPKFRDPPTRWLVIRKLDSSTIQPPEAPINQVEGWVVESDRVRNLNDLDESVDLQVDVTPYIESSEANAKDPRNVNIGKQAEIFIGYRESAQTWSESDKPLTRVDLGLLNSSNQLFPDYQPHNSNVFSILDTFNYIDSDGQTKYLTDAVADYYVLGWHTDRVDDPFTLDGSTRSARLAELNMTLNDKGALATWLNSSTDTRAICHGAMYQVEWHKRWTADSGSNRPQKLPGDEFTRKLIQEMPVAVGTTPIDTLLAYIHVNHEDELESDINRIATLLRAQSDSVTDQQAGEDEVQNYNFGTTGGGAYYVLPIEKERPAQPPSKDDQRNLLLLNEAQTLLDSVQRAKQTVQWNLFSLWWKYVTDIDNTTAQVRGRYKEQADDLTAKYNVLTVMARDQQDAVDELYNEFLLKNLTPKKATLGEFAQARDPTVFLAGSQAGWPEDFLNALIGRLDYQIDTFNHPDNRDFEKFFIKCVPSVLQQTALALVQEFVQNRPSLALSSTRATRSVDVSFKTFPPLYHDQGDPTLPDPPPPGAPWRDRWESTQPWFPLFIEWEAEFFHVEYDKWTLDSVTSRMESQAKFRHGVKTIDARPLWEDESVVQDTRTLSGRILINPQPSFSLKAQIDQLFSSTPPDVLDEYLPKAERDKLQAKVATMPYLSSPLTGFVNQLATTMQGNHLKPNIRVPGNAPIPLVAAYKASEDVDLGEKQLKDIGIETDLTPYGSLVPLPVTTYAAFKPVTHGQFRFTKLNLIDKFGQCAPAIDQLPRPTGPPPLYPCVSDYFAPQVKDNYADVAIKPESEDVCEFTQIPPQVNQASRLNAYFVVPDKLASSSTRPAYWRPMQDFDDQNPIWGWVVVNYVDNGVQFFLNDGTFYREARKASPENPNPVSAAKRWQPFGRGQNTPNTSQIDRLINLFTDTPEGQVYLESFIAMITHSLNQSKPSPSAYGQYINALVGKPLALVNIGYSLELATDARTNQSTASSQVNLHTKYHLLPSDLSDGDKDVYRFPLKLGDHDRLYDGLVGYFRADPKPWERSPTDGNELDLKTLYTYDKDVATSAGFAAIDKSTFPELKAFYQDPLDFAGFPDPAAQFQFTTNAQLNSTVFGCIVDPFIPVHAYMGGGIAPVQPLQLPDWTWQASLKNMTAFFHFGPLVVTEDISAWNKKFELPNNYADKLDQLTVPDSALQLPSLKLADWRWLQGYSVPEDSFNRNGEIHTESNAEEKFMALGLGKLDATPRFQAGPYTAIEGYLQMKQPLQVDVGMASP